MANKYIRHGETFNGDGTTSAAATSDGGVGAWNTITYFEGASVAYGTLVAGDVVYIRSKSAAGADITRTATVTTTVGSTVATAAAPITWVLDAGTVWPGIDGILRYTTTTSNVSFNIAANNVITADTRGNLHFQINMASPAENHVVGMNVGCHLKNARIDLSAQTATGPRCAAVASRSNGSWTLESPMIVLGARPSANSPASSVLRGGEFIGEYWILDPDIEYTNSTALNSSVGLFSADSFYPRSWNVIGGRLRGAGAISGQAVIGAASTVANVANSVFVYGMDIPRAMPIAPPLNTVGAQSISIIGCDGGVGGHFERPWGWATSRSDNNPPFLSATLPNSLSTGWSWRVYPYNASSQAQMHLPTMKLYTDLAATKTITQEILIANTMVANRSNLWITVDYTDAATGMPRHISTQDFAAGALASSTANWSATVWGMVSFNKYKFEVVTPTSIKQNTPITVALHGTLKSATVNDIFFVDPDFGVN